MTKLEFFTSLTEMIECLVGEGINSFNVYQIRGYLDRLCEDFLDYHGEYDDCSIYDREQAAKKKAQEVVKEREKELERKLLEIVGKPKEAKQPRKYYNDLHRLIDAGCIVTDVGEVDSYGV